MGITLSVQAVTLVFRGAKIPRGMFVILMHFIRAWETVRLGMAMFIIIQTNGLYFEDLNMSKKAPI